MYSSSYLQGLTLIHQRQDYTGYYNNYGILGVSKNLLEYEKVMTGFEVLLLLS